MHLAPIDISPAPRYRRIPAPLPHAEAAPVWVEPAPAHPVKKPLHWALGAVLVWELSQVLVGLWFGVKLALAIT